MLGRLEQDFPFGNVGVKQVVSLEVESMHHQNQVRNRTRAIERELTLNSVKARVRDPVELSWAEAFKRGFRGKLETC